MIGMLMQPETFSVEDLRRQLRESPGFSRGEEIKQTPDLVRDNEKPSLHLWQIHGRY